jgi:hypothetical protein
MEEEIQYCKSPLLDPSLFPSGSANFLNPNYNVLPFLCNLLQVANDETISPVLVEQPEFDISPFNDFSSLLSVGDPRISLGEMLSATHIHFLPKIIAQNEILQAGGTQIIDSYICDKDGNQIKKSEKIPILLSLDLTGKTPYKYGSITIPPIQSSLEDLLKRFDSEDIKDFVKNYFNEKIENHAEYFVNFINTHYIPAGWSVFLNFNSASQIFYIEMRNGKNKIYLKYYPDVKEKVAKMFGIKNITVYPSYGKINSQQHAAALGAAIPNYKEIMEDDVKKINFINTIKNTYTEDSSQSFNTFTTNPTANLQMFKQMFNKFNEVSNQTSTIEVDLS